LTVQESINKSIPFVKLLVKEIFKHTLNIGYHLTQIILNCFKDKKGIPDKETLTGLSFGLPIRWVAKEQGVWDHSV